MAENNPKLTQFANQAMIVATALATRFAQKEYGNQPARRLRIDEPEGPSTDGGRKARQPLSLVPVAGAAPALVAGWVDVSLGEGELRPYGAIANKYQARYGMPPDISREEYGRFLTELETSLRQVGVKNLTVTADEPFGQPKPSGVALPAMVQAQSAPAAQNNTMVFIAAGAAVAVGILILLFALR